MTRIYTYFLLSWLSLGAVCRASVLQVDSLHRQAVSIHLGTTGPGVFYSRQLSSARRLTVRLGGHYISYQKQIRVEAATDSYVQIKPDFTIGVAEANLIWHPFRRSSFYVTGGIAYTWHPDLRLTLTTEDKLTLDGLELLPQDVGTVNLAFHWHPLVGYLGWGFGRTIPKSRFGAGVEMGLFYLGKPSVSLDYEGFLETTTIDEQVPAVERNLSNYRYLPSINLTVSYRLTGSK
ncbi:hypothetical protein [Spirosoma fluviale]|uniref:Outer membrane protein beta-barrel domain-containing protein n=1 Tax=Spirosoma fluviale TaxID=1597977 RepID=A0A286G9M6_9BACT|nr:hypothetical protein [Spirosoma fluviale]SOD91829.1 hypothetical protein SAMN06269250_3661 [Spirosoma fluviale]